MMYHKAIFRLKCKNVAEDNASQNSTPTINLRCKFRRAKECQPTKRGKMKIAGGGVLRGSATRKAADSTTGTSKDN
jgi:hypothetical protein